MFQGPPVPRRVAAVALLCGAFAASPVAAQGLGLARGHALAQEWCARCHAISPAQERPGESDVPSFRRIAADRRWTRTALINMITVPHANMPPPVLTAAEAEEVAMYILSLR
jgi:mono/diheme cytochrome c family protein